MSEKLDTEKGIVSIRMPMAIAKEAKNWLEDLFKDFSQFDDESYSKERLLVAKLVNQFEASIEIHNQKEQGQQTLFQESWNALNAAGNWTFPAVGIVASRAQKNVGKVGVVD